MPGEAVSAAGRGGAGEHAVDDPDVDDLGVQRPAAGLVDGVGAVAAHQPEQPVDLPHLRPGQWMFEHRRRIGADMSAVVECFALQRSQVPHRIGVELAGQVRRIGLPAARDDPGMDFDQLTTEVSFTVAVSTRAVNRCPTRSPGML